MMVVNLVANFIIFDPVYLGCPAHRMHTGQKWSMPCSKHILATLHEHGRPGVSDGRVCGDGACGVQVALTHA